ncbi:MAG TPA: glutaminase A [Candidatus Akkermansia intestinigallinarum]|uniref:Glutaminase n=1 Tax=Candidatus Akkermansia intestinigallinarum TaxID=2838431 RepID=A0A9D1VAF2_9BACT|nr:glutaminase A [Candidatus Akkermansia intestinigallinarum]
MNTTAISADQIRQCLQEAHDRFLLAPGGKNASYIPALARVDSKLFGLAAATVDGQVITVGDSEVPFAIESISKAFNLSLVMDVLGAATVRRKIGAEATGEAFNSVMALELHGGRPLNPLVNAGAISAVSLVPGGNAAAVWTKMMARFTELAGHELPVMNEVYESESATNQHNKGLAWLLDSYGFLYNDPTQSVDLYTRMCSLAVSTRDLAVMGACYAAGGINPLTTRRVVRREHVPQILADMMMEGLYTGSGDWLYANGLPAKSGVGGGLVCVVPGRLALAAFSPPLDEAGNSVRGQLALSYVIDELGLSLLR